MAPTVVPVTSGVGKKKKHSYQVPYITLTLLGTHLPAAALPNSLDSAQMLDHSFFPRLLKTGAAAAAPTAWARWDGVLLAWSAGGGGKPPQLSLTPEVGVACHH